MNTSLIQLAFYAIVFVVMLIFPLGIFGQTAAPAYTLDAAKRGEVLNNLIKEMNDSYVFPEVAKQMEADLRSREKNKEYDALTDDYARMILQELLPAVARRWRFADDPRRRAIGGTSSGAIAAWTVAWRHPDAFGNVISFVGSYTSIGLKLGSDGTPLAYGGDTYPGLIRKSPIRPLRVFLQDGRNDLDNEHGNWFLANQQMLLSLQWANAHADAEQRTGPRYDVRHVWTDGAHSDADGGAILPEVLRWIWRDQPA